MPVPVDLSKLNDIIKNDVVKKTVYDKLVANVNSIDTSGFAFKTKYDTAKSHLENKIPDSSGFVKKPDYNNKITHKDKITYSHVKIVNIYIAYEINKNNDTSSDPTLENYLFGPVSLTKNANIDKYKYSGYGIGFDRHGFFSHPSGGTDRNVIIFGGDISSSTKIDNRKKIS